MIGDRQFFAVIEAASDLNDRISQRHFAPAVRARNGVGNIAKERELDQWTNFLIAQGITNLTSEVRLRHRDQLPQWAREIRRMFQALPKIKLEGRSKSLKHHIIEPAIFYARDRLRRRLRRRPQTAFERAVISRFERQLRRILTQTAKSCLALHFAGFEAAYRCLFTGRKNVSRQEMERAFVGEHPGDRLVILLQTFPALARLWAEVITNWTDKICELGLRLTKDQKAIFKTFFADQRPGRLLRVKINISDPHYKGRETVVLCYEHGDLVYKPRDGQNEREWFSVLRWLNWRGFSPPFRTLRILQRKGYCWMEFVRPQPCQSEHAARRYHRRAGGFLCIAYLLGAIDCHCDNFIAAGEHPVLIDAETLFHPDTGLKLSAPDSIFRTGLLALPDARFRRYEISALGGTLPRPHTPMLDGAPLRIANYSEQVLAGFRDVWKLIGRAKTPGHEAFRRRVRPLTRQRWRRVYWPTRRYLDIRDGSVDAATLRSGIARSQQIGMQVLRTGVEAPIIVREIDSIARFDVPHFTEIPGRLTVLPKVSLPDFLARLSASFSFRAAVSS